MQKFPRGACGDSSLLLGAYLKDLGISGFSYISASRGDCVLNTWTSHAWLQSGVCVIDITAGQFPDAPSKIIVASPSPWHLSFDAEEPSESDFRLWSGYGADILHPMYGLLLEALKHEEAP